jgi:hypothetical protein
MADTLQQLSLIQLATKFADEIVGQVNRASTLATILDKRLGNNAGGPNWVAQSSGQLAETASEGADVSNFGSDSQTAALLAWGNYRSNFHVSDEAMSRAIIAGNPSGNVALWARNMLNAVDAAAKLVNQDSFTGTGASNSIVGLHSALDDANTYAGIDRSSNSYWRATKTAPGTLTTITKSLIRADLSAIAVAGGIRPDLAVCNPKTFGKIVDTFDTQRQFMTLASSGFQSNFLGDRSIPFVDIDGCRFVEDVDGYASNNNGYVYYLNSSHVYYEYVPYVDVQGFGGTQVLTGGDQLPNLPFGMQFVPLAKAGSSSKAMVRFQCQLVVERPNRCGIRKDLNIA